MKAFIKFVLTSTGMVLILIGVGFLLVFTQTQNYMTDRVGDVLTETFASDCRVGAISLDPTKRALVLQDFAILNPEGFKEGEAFACDRVRVVFEIRSLISPEPIIELIDLEGAHIYYRHEIGRGTNIGVIAQRLRNKPAGETTVRVKRLLCEGGQAHLDTNLLPGDGVPINMVRIELRDLESGEPITPAMVTSLFLRSVLKEAVTLSGLTSSFMNRLRDDVKELED